MHRVKQSAQKPYSEQTMYYSKKSCLIETGLHVSFHEQKVIETLVLPFNTRRAEHLNNSSLSLKLSLYLHHNLLSLYSERTYTFTFTFTNLPSGNGSINAQIATFQPASLTRIASRFQGRKLEIPTDCESSSEAARDNFQRTS